jgi:hypothetical protein
MVDPVNDFEIVQIQIHSLVALYNWKSFQNKVSIKKLLKPIFRAWLVFLELLTHKNLVKLNQECGRKIWS